MCPFDNDDADLTSLNGRLGYDLPWKGELSLTGRYSEPRLPVAYTVPPTGLRPQPAVPVRGVPVQPRASAAHPRVGGATPLPAVVEYNSGFQNALLASRPGERNQAQPTRNHEVRRGSIRGDQAQPYRDSGCRKQYEGSARYRKR